MSVVGLRPSGVCPPPPAMVLPPVPQSHANNPDGGNWLGPAQPLEGTWLNADRPEEHYVVEGQSVERTDARGTRRFTIRWNNFEQQWQWGVYGRLSLQWLGDGAIAWVPAQTGAGGTEQRRVWYWRRCRSSTRRPSDGRDGLAHRSNHGYRSSSAISSYDTRRRSSTRRRSRSRSRDRDHYGRTRSYDRYRDHSGDHRRYRTTSRGRGHGSRHGGRRYHEGSHYGGARLPCGLTAMEVSSLYTRDITPEDYEMLLRLDEALPKKTTSADIVERLPLAAEENIESGATCTVCLLGLQEVGDVVELPCRHHFHRPCVSRWLSEFNTTCPNCSAELSPRP